MLRRIDWGLVLRMLSYLQENTGVNRTRLSLKCRSNYASCVRYLAWMELMGMVTVGRHVTITERGIRIIRDARERYGISCMRVSRGRAATHDDRALDTGPLPPDPGVGIAQDNAA